ncbi:Sec34-domain-containing protein [Artomyces pyxidatus]|uniref:Sec34-domain-containing protein n=1 Tax=Artomyces pyxidatus TaxID=48021 RepID=A0ACB8SS99_9AGAM|nr:Sec34-domain-containing protein [Artomyces pyxidatus]
MAGRSSAVRRVGTPVSPSPHSKASITMEEWEAKAQLGDLESRSVLAVKAASERPQLPFKFATDEAGPSSRPSTPLRTKLGPGPSSRPSTPGIPSSRSQQVGQSHALHPKQPVQTPQQFYDWFALIDRSVAHSQEAHFRQHLLSVSEHLELCDRLVERVEKVEREVDGMLEGWRSVEEGGKSLQDASQKLLEERDRLVDLQEAIGSRLEYFQELEHATRMLNHPGESLVLQTDFLYMAERVDICIDFLKAHRHFKEAEVYLLRFQQCMTRAMTLIKMYFIGSLRALTQDVSRRLSEKDVSQTAQMHLLYTRFTSVSAQLEPLLSELERRARSHPDELGALLAECHSAYFSARKALLIGRIAEEIRGLDPTRTELVELTRSGCSYLKQLCTDEFNLYRSFFSSGRDMLYQYLENLCDYLYDDLRPRILHESRLTALCEVCTVLQALMVLDLPTLEDGSSDEEPADELTLDFEHARKEHGLGRLHIRQLLQMVLQDAQTRLFFKAQSVIQSEIRYYAPKPEDLAYPDKLIAARQPATGNEIREKESISQLFQLSSLDKRETWFPTLSKTVWVLSQLHDFVQPAIFDDLAQEAINLCRQSLSAAADMLSSKNPPSTVLDGYLFLIRHLLILKEMTRNLDPVQKDTGRGSNDPYGVTDTLASMLTRTTNILPTSLFASFGMPRGDETTDAKHGIDLELKRACEALISHMSDPVIVPLRSFVDQVNTHQTSAKPGLLVTQEWAKQSVAENLDADFRSACLRDLRHGVARLRLYLEERRTVDVLVQHVRERVEEEYVGFREVAKNMYAGALRERLLTDEGLKGMLIEVCEERED